VCGEAGLWCQCACIVAGDSKHMASSTTDSVIHPLLASRGHLSGLVGGGGSGGLSNQMNHLNQTATSSDYLMENGQSNGSASTRRDHNIDYSSLFVQLSGTFPTLYRCVSCHKTVSNRWHHANIHRPQSHQCPICGQKFTRRDNMKAHCKVKHGDIRDRYYAGHYVQMWSFLV
jgi:DNA-directed RNA polymerase subunit RPC12/RpoP